MTEKEKLLAGKIYDPADSELIFLREKAHRLCKEYNDCLETDSKREAIIAELLENKAENIGLQGPIQFDYGCFTSIGKNTFINFNLS